MADPVEQARHGYAEELRFTARVSSPAVVNAFAAVPRERFVGPGPWLCGHRRVPGSSPGKQRGLTLGAIRRSKVVEGRAAAGNRHRPFFDLALNLKIWQ
jgi:hypothetical protein